MTDPELEWQATHQDALDSILDGLAVNRHFRPGTFRDKDVKAKKGQSSIIEVWDNVNSEVMTVKCVPSSIDRINTDQWDQVLICMQIK